MTLEILEDGGARIVATGGELRTLTQNVELALRVGASHAAFLTDAGVARFVIQVRAA